MPKSDVTLDLVKGAAGAAGLDFRGAFHPAEEDAVPGPCGTLVLLGNAGPRMWRAFSVWRAFNQVAEVPDSGTLDEWSTRVIGRLAGELGAAPLLPFGGPPWHPFLRWAQRAEPVFPSPIGPMIHPRHGLWHAYRGALAFSERLELSAPEAVDSPCDSCADRPCLTSCPVNAFGPSGYDVPACVAHLSTPQGKDCRERGCIARRACPVGRSTQYAPEQAAFHMRAFHESQLRNEPA